MLTRTVRTQVLAFVVIALVLVSYVAVRYVGVLRWVGAAGYTVRVELPRAGGIFTNAEVTYRGVPVGRVGPLRLTATGIEVELEITSRRKIPRDLRAVVTDRSVIGEQYLDLRPRTSAGPYLRDGSVIAQRDTALPPGAQDLLLSGDELARSVPIGALQTVVDEVYQATAGISQDLRTLLDSSRSLFGTATDYLPPTLSLIDSSTTVLATQNRESAAIRSFAANLALIGQQLKASDGDIRTVLTRAAPAAAEAGGLFRDIDDSATSLLSNLLTTSAVFLAGKDGVRELLVKLPVAVTIGGAVITPQGINVGLVPTFFDPLPCIAGYQGTKVRAGLSTSGNPALNTAATCTAPASTGSDLRGSQHAPAGPR
jgi:phospholipid/cholesterol/gamma-HCH transport system substrate-binding protein